MARGGEPVVNRSPDRSAAYRRLSRSMMAGDEQYYAVAARDRLLERPVDRAPSAVESHSVKVDNSIGLNPAAGKAAVPTSVERRARRPPFLRQLGAASRPD